MHAVIHPPPPPKKSPPYYVQDLAGGPLKEFPDQWTALRYAYCTYGMAKFRLLTEEEALLAK